MGPARQLRETSAHGKNFLGFGHGHRIAQIKFFDSLGKEFSGPCVESSKERRSGCRMV